MMWASGQYLRLQDPLKGIKCQCVYISGELRKFGELRKSGELENYDVINGELHNYDIINGELQNYDVINIGR